MKKQTRTTVKQIDFAKVARAAWKTRRAAGKRAVVASARKAWATRRKAAKAAKSTRTARAK
jgi:molybdopterin-guanine dinucleotide biosynthesis protein